MLTKRQKQILDYIKKYIEQHDYSPTLEEIRKHFDLSSISTIHQHIEALKSKGYLEKEENKTRSITTKESSNTEIPLLGYIAAGNPIEAIENQDTISVNKKQLSKTGEHFALKVKGESMIDEGIMGGDVVVVKKQETANDGETIVAKIDDNKVTLKKIFREKNKFRLQPANSKMEPIYTKNLQIKGKVVSIIRKYNDEPELLEQTKNYIQNSDDKYRKEMGQYFTPRTIREKLLSKIPRIDNAKILDPACGTGEFLLTANKFFSNSKIYGWEVDKKLSKLTKKIAPFAQVSKKDSLKVDFDSEKFDIIIGNPPYFEFKPELETKEKYKEAINGRINIFNLFIYLSIKLLKKQGYLGFIVPPSMNNGAYFSKLRKFIIKTCNIKYISTQESDKYFEGAQQTVMLIVFEKSKSKKSNKYVFENNGVSIFSEDYKKLKKVFKKSKTLVELGFKARTGKIVWNQNKEKLTDSKKNSVPLIWSKNITNNGLKLDNHNKPQYIKHDDPEKGPAIAVNRIVGNPGNGKIRAAYIPKGMDFLAENHVNVIYKSEEGFNFDENENINLKQILKQLKSPNKKTIVQSITGNTQISKTEIENLIPFAC